MESIRLGGPVHGIVTRTVCKTLPGAFGDPGVGGMSRGWWGSREWWGSGVGMGGEGPGVGG